MEAIIFALISYFTWGTGVFVEAIVARKLHPYSLIFWTYLFSFILMSFYAPFVLSDLKNLTVGILVLIIILSFQALFLGAIFYYEAFRVGNRALVGTIASSFPLVSVILSVIFLGDRISNDQILAIIIIFIGLFLSVVNFKAISSKDILSKSSLLALFTCVSWGIYLAFIKIPVDKIGWFWPIYLYYFIFPIVFILLKIRKIPLEKPTKNNALLFIIGSIALVRIAELSYTFAISKGLVAIVAPISGANPTLFVILAFLFFKDRITRHQIAGILTTLIGIVLLSIVSV